MALCRSQQKSYLGCEYFAVDLDNANVPCGSDAQGGVIFCDASSKQFAVVVSNADNSGAAHISITRGTPEDLAPEDVVDDPSAPPLDPYHVAAAIIPPKGIKIFNLPKNQGMNGTIKAKNAFRIASNVPISVYQFNPLDNVAVYSNDASLLLPTTSVGTDYLVMTREQTFDELKGYLTVVGIQDTPTDVAITVTARTIAGPDIPALEPGESYVATLEKFDVLNIESDGIGEDLTGSRVQASAAVVVYGGSEAANVPNSNRCNLQTLRCEYDPSIACGCPEDSGPQCSPHAPCTISRLITCCADHLEQQMYPVSAWGDEYVAVRSMPRGSEKDVWRIMARDAHTRITFTPEVHAAIELGAGEWLEFESELDFVIRADAPILVGQFLSGQDAPGPGRQTGDAGTGDPSFMLSVPMRQLRESYVFLAPNKYAEDYISLALQEDGAARLDGQDVLSYPDAQTAAIGNTGWMAVRLSISDGFHSLVCPGNCSVMVHGYDQYVSYGYPGGLNLKDE